MIHNEIPSHETHHIIPCRRNSNTTKNTTKIGDNLDNYPKLSLEQLKNLKEYLVEGLNSNSNPPVTLAGNEYQYQDYKSNLNGFLYTKSDNNDLIIGLFDNGKFIEGIIYYGDNNEKKLCSIGKFKKGELIKGKTIYPHDVIIDTEELNEYLNSSKKS